MGRKKHSGTERSRSGNGANLGFEEKLWAAADKLRGHMDAAEYKHVVLGLIFLKYISDAFQERYDAPQGRAATPTPKTATSTRPRTSSGCRKEARWAQAPGQRQAADHRQADRRRDGRHREGEPVAQGRAAEGLRPAVARQDPARRADRPDRHDRASGGRSTETTAPRTCSAASTSTSSASSPAPRARRGGEFYTPQSRRPAAGRDDRAVQGPRLRPLLRLGRHVRAVREVRRGPRRPASATSSIYGQESNPTTWRLCKMNLAIRGIEANLGPQQRRHVPQRPAQGPEGRLHPRQSAVQRQRLGRRAAARGRPLEVRRAAGRQRQLRLGPALHPSPGARRGIAGFVLANGSMSSNQSGEGDIRQAIVEADLVDCMVALPGQLFYTTQIPVCLWFLARSKKQRQVPRPPGRDAVHRRPQAGPARRPHPPRTDRRGDRPDRQHLPRLARREGRRASTPTCPASARAPRREEIAAMASCSRRAATSGPRMSRTTASRSRRRCSG